MMSLFSIFTRFRKNRKVRRRATVPQISLLRPRRLDRRLVFDAGAPCAVGSSLLSEPLALQTSENAQSDFSDADSNDVALDSATSQLLTIELQDSEITEDDLVRLFLRPTDAVQASLTVEVDWGDGSSPDMITLLPGSSEAFLDHRYRDDNPSDTSSDIYTIRATAAQDSNPPETVETEILVRNLDPQLLNLKLDSVVNEDGIATLTGGVRDLGKEDTHTLSIDWDGDGQFDQTVDVGLNFSITHRYVDDDPTATDGDSYQVRVLLQDDDGGSDSESLPITVRNLAPTIVFDPLSPINEGDEIRITGTYHDMGPLDTHILDIDWDGDGIYDRSIRTRDDIFSMRHRYLDDDPSGTSSDTITINLRLYDDDGGEVFASQTLTINNLNPTVQLEAPDPIDEGESTLLRGSITDAGILDTFELQLDWGNPGDPNNLQSFILGDTPLTLSEDGIEWNPVARTFVVEHRYFDDDPSSDPENVYQIRVRAIDDDTGLGEATTSILVRNVDATLVLAPDQTVEEGALLDLSGGMLGQFTDLGERDAHYAFVDWGDGSSLQSVAVNEMAGSGTLSGSHVYADNGVYTVTVTVADDDASLVSGTFEVTVQNVDPRLSGVDSIIQVNEGEWITLASLGVGLEDPGFDNPANPLVARGSQELLYAMGVDWGDGGLTQLLAIDTRTNGSATVPTRATLLSPMHAYADDGQYTVSVFVNDDDGDLVQRTFLIQVNNVAPTLVLTDRFLEIKEGETLDLFDLGIFSDPGFDNPANPNGASKETFTYSINWGDDREDSIKEGLLPETLTTGGPGVPSTGELAASHTYDDNNEINTFKIVVTLKDDDGGEVTEHIQVRVLNVNPVLYPLSATDVSPQGITVLTLSFFDPGTDSFRVMVDWGDDSSGDPNDPFVLAKTYDDITPTTIVLSHKYNGPPNPDNPAADITIRVKILDDDFGAAQVVDDGESNLETIAISNPGIGREFIRVDTTPQVPQLTFPDRSNVGFVVDASRNVSQSQNTIDLQSAVGDSKAATERFLELRVIDAMGREREGYRLRIEVLQDLPGLFRRLPDNHYALYLVNLETNTRRLVLEVFVRNGKLIDPGDDSEGTRDRPPTEAPIIEPQELPTEVKQREPTNSDQAVPIQPGPNESETSGDLQENSATEVGTGVSMEDRVFPGRLSSRAIMAMALAATPATLSWARQVDQTLAKATAYEWRKLHSQNQKNPKKQ